MLAMGENEDEARAPTGLERLAGLLAATKENASAEISKLDSQVQALEIERRTLEAALEACRDELGDAKSLVQQLRLENTRKWRVEERDDWRALLDSMQADRTALQRQNDRLEGELTRCITALLSIFPSSSPFPRSGRAKVGDANGTAAGGGDAKGAGDGDHPPELTHRSISSGSDGRRPVSSRGIAAVNLEWVGSLAEEFNVALEGVVAEGDDGDAGKGGGGGGEEGGGGGARSPNGGGDAASECLRLRVQLDALKHESDTAKVALESQVFEQEQELKKLRREVSRSDGKGSSRRGVGEGATAERGGGSFAGVFRWWRHDRSRAAADGAGARGAVAGGVTVV
ncbi:unnamed protein product [Ectocarpus sp. 4 AP-2014]